MRADLLRLRRDFDSGTLRTIVRPVPNPLGGEHVGPPTPWLMTGQAAIAGTIASTVLLLGLIVSRQLMPPLNHTDGASEVMERKPIRQTSIFLPSPEKLPVQAPAELRAVNQEIEVAQTKANAGLHEQALETLRSVLMKYPDEPEAINAYFLMGSVQQAQEQHADAMATYLEIAHRFRDDARASEALYRFADLTLRSRRANKDSEARDVLGQLANTYPDVIWAPRALMMKAEIEERKRLYERDRRLGISVPSALVTYRRLTSTYPAAEENRIASEKLAKLYEEIKRFDLAAATFVDLGTRYPSAEPDAWYRAAELYRRRLNNAKLAQSAYANVPSTSRYFKNAQSRLR